MFDLEQLRCFVAVAEHESVAQAAELLPMAPSPLSRKIRQLERSVGTDLFDRRRQRLFLTPAGRDLLVEARRLLAHAERVASLASAVTGEGIPFDLGHVAGVSDTAWFAPSLARFVDRCPEARIELTSSLRSPELFTALEGGTLDAAFTYRPAPEGSALVSTIVDDEPLMVALPPDHPAAGQPATPLPPGSLDGEPFVALAASASPRGRHQIDTTLQACGVTPDVRVETTDPATAVALVAEGIGIGLVRAGSLSADRRGVVLCRPPSGFTLTVPIYVTVARSPRRITEQFRLAVLLAGDEDTNG